MVEYYLMSSSTLNEIKDNAVEHCIWWNSKAPTANDDFLKIHKGDKILFFLTPDRTFIYAAEVSDEPVKSQELQNFQQLNSEVNLIEDRVVIKVSSLKEINFEVTDETFLHLNNLGVFGNSTSDSRSYCQGYLQGTPRGVLSKTGQGKEAYEYIIRNSKAVLKMGAESRVTTVQPGGEYQPRDSFKSSETTTLEINQFISVYLKSWCNIFKEKFVIPSKDDDFGPGDSTLLFNCAAFDSIRKLRLENPDLDISLKGENLVGRGAYSDLTICSSKTSTSYIEIEHENMPEIHQKGTPIPKLQWCIQKLSMSKARDKLVITVYDNKYPKEKLISDAQNYVNMYFQLDNPFYLLIVPWEIDEDNLSPSLFETHVLKKK